VLLLTNYRLIVKKERKKVQFLLLSNKILLFSFAHGVLARTRVVRKHGVGGSRLVFQNKCSTFPEGDNFLVSLEGREAIHSGKAKVNIFFSSFK
jgi:hypothetical protein